MTEYRGRKKVNENGILKYLTKSIGAEKRTSKFRLTVIILI